MRRRNLTREAIGVARDALDVTREITSEAVDITKRSVATASGAVALAEALSEKLSSMPHNEVLSADELETFAQAFPNWSVTSGIANGKAVKTYQRTITARELPKERREGGQLAHETYLRLADTDHSDMGLAEVFGAYHVEGDYVNGRYYVVSVRSDENGPITYDDFSRVVQAEDYLLTQGYIKASPTATAA